MILLPTPKQLEVFEEKFVLRYDAYIVLEDGCSPLLIAGGEYRLCDGTESGCACKGCHKRRCPTVRTEAKSGNNSKEGSDEDCHSIG